MSHINQFRQNKKQSRAAKNAASNSKVESFKAFEAPNLEDSHNAVELALQRYSIFSLQNVETGHFDVTFVFKEGALYAHSFVLWSASEVFETMLFGSWAKKDPIPITGHTYDEFREFLIFLYLGKCNINMENVMAIVDLAESYNVQLLKDKCDQYLTEIVPTVENVFKVCETLKVYSLQNALANLYEFVTINATTLLKSQAFLETKKDIVMDIVKMERLVIKEELLFESVYKWAEYQYEMQDVEDPLWIKKELSDILPHIHFPIMNIEFLHNDIVPLGYLFSSFTELSLILRDADAFHTKTLVQPASKYLHTVRTGFNLQFKDIRGNVAHAYLRDITLIESHSAQVLRCSHSYNNFTGTYIGCFWNIDIPKPTTKINILDLKFCKLYIYRNAQGKLALKDFSIDVSANVNQQDHYRGGMRFMGHSRQNRNPYNTEIDPEECDIIAHVFCENDNFIVDQGCNLRII